MDTRDTGSPKSYDISTLRDIFEKVPTDRVPALMREMEVMIIQAQAMRDLVRSVSDDGEVGIEWPGVVVWTDDEKHTIDLHVVPESGSDEGFTLRTQLNPERA